MQVNNRYIIIFIVLQLSIISSRSNCQDSTIFGNTGSIWHYSIYTSFNEYSLFQFVAANDTLINGNLCRIIKGYKYENGELIYDVDYNKYIIVIENKVFHKVQNDFILLFDFGANSGDTIHSAVETFPISMGCNEQFIHDTINFRYIIDSTNHININGINLRQQFVHVISTNGITHNWYFSNPIVERIGTFGSGGFWWGSGEECLPEGSGYFRCYSDNELTFRNPNYDFPCDFTSNEIIERSKMYIFPNPAEDFLFLNAELSNVSIFNLRGELVLKEFNNGFMDISDLAPGYYWITSDDINNLGIVRFIKI